MYACMMYDKEIMCKIGLIDSMKSMFHFQSNYIFPTTVAYKHLQMHNESEGNGNTRIRNVCTKGIHLIYVISMFHSGSARITPTFTMIPWAIPSPIICLHSSTSVVMDVYKFLAGHSALKFHSQQGFSATLTSDFSFWACSMAKNRWNLPWQ